jgi:hypothetical protein
MSTVIVFSVSLCVGMGLEYNSDIFTELRLILSDCMKTQYVQCSYVDGISLTKTFPYSSSCRIHKCIPYFILMLYIYFKMQKFAE